MSYNGGEIFELPGVDIDTLDVFFVQNYYKNIGYDKVTQSWWLVPNRPLQTSLRAVTDDKELMEMCYLAQKNKGVIHVYYEHGVSEHLYSEKAELVSFKGKELMVIQNFIPTPNPTTNVTIEPIPTTTPSTPTSEPNDTTIPPQKIVSTTKPTDNLSLGPKQKIPPTSVSVGKPNIPEKIHPQSIANLRSKSNLPPKTMAEPKTKKSDVPKRGSKNLKIIAPYERRPLTRAAATETIARSIAKEKQPQKNESSDSHDSDDSVKDEPYRPDCDEVFSEKDVVVERSAGKKTNVKLRTRTDKKLTKQKSAAMVKDDGPVCADSESEDDELFCGPIPEFGSMAPYYNAQDEAYHESDGGDSWHSEEMKTPPNFEDELEEVDSDEVFPVFREGGRFGELKLEIEMTFTT
ncbi:hypothetical protein Ahy_B06g085132 isoform B [Arachis hypogaea]|uniref:PB1-like domain-containing protein n=1 Tax=Arachis hypogaea TaxID=3818 RepID=A0A444YTJ9_ARAHY|nr:hypothetical protein Ahy_B06g085132 isoform B [Arachis hypogaea]